MEKKRNFNLDVIRSVALFYVICVHFFMNANFYYAGTVTGISMELSVILRNCFTACVPLFLMLSGYLMNKKTISVKYYTGISKVLILYALSCIAIWIFSVFKYGTVHTLDSLLTSFLGYEGYAWYIGMYVGLYALIPFLNLMYHGLSSKKQKILLLCVLLYFTALPSLTNKFGVNLIPTNWESLYPITYYYIGAFLSEYADDIKIPTIGLFVLYLLVVLSGGMFVNRFVRDQLYYSVNLFVDWNNLLNFTSTTILFLTILKCDFSKLPNILRKLIETISKVSLQMYLVSWIFDQIVYESFNAKYATYADKFIRMPLPIIQVFVSSFIVALIIQFIYDKIKGITSYETKKLSS